MEDAFKSGAVQPLENGLRLVESVLGEKAKSDSDSGNASEKPWRHLVQSKRPECPIDIFPGKIRDLIIQVNRESGCPIDYVVCAITSVICASVFDRFNIQAKENHVFPPTLYQFLIGESGSMKSYPIRFFGKELIHLTNEKNEEIRCHNKRIQREIDRQEKQEKGKNADLETIEQNISNLEREKTPYYPYIVTDPTMEGLSNGASECGGGNIVLSSEATLVNAITGTSYNQKGNTPNIDIVLAGYDGDPATILRAGKATLSIPDLRLCICVGGQKSTLEKLTRVGEQVDRGFPSRGLFYIPEEQYDHDATNEIPIEQSLLNHWNKLVGTLFNSNRGRDKARISLSSDASVLYAEYRNHCTELKCRARHEGNIKGWIAKQADKAVRYASILMLMDQPSARLITKETLEKAIRFMDNYALPMACYAYGITGDSLTEEQAQCIARIRNIQEKNNGRCTEGKLKDRHYRNREKELERILQYLDEHNYIRKKRNDANRGSCDIEVNPYYKD